MTGPLPDDDVRAMLEERAGRVSPDAEREAMTTFRAAVRGAPDGKGGFAVIPQALSSRDARLPWGLAAAGMVAVVAIALLGGRLSGTDFAASPSAASGATATSGPAASLEPSADGNGLPTADQLRAGLADGSLTGRVIVIDGEMQAVQVPCPKPGACTVPMLTRLGGIPITVDPTIEALVANDVPDGPHVFIGDGVGLTYLGNMTGAVDAPMTVAELWAVSPAVDETGIRFVEGIVGPIPCAGCPTGPTMLPGQWLSGTNGSKAAAVPVFVPDTIEPPPSLDRYLVRPRFASPCDDVTPPPGVVWDCAAEYRWAIVAAVGDEPILRVALP
jgi:hypothetical protein